MKPANLTLRMLVSIVSILISAGASAVVVVSASAGDHDSEPPDGPLLPKWRLQAAPLDYPGRVSLGVYRRLGSRWDAGLSLQTSWVSRDDDNSGGTVRHDARIDTTTGGGSSHDFSLTSYLDLRRWYPVAGRAAWFIGPQLGFEYRRGTDFNHSSHTLGYSGGSSYSDTREWGESASTGVNLILGVDVQLLSRLSLTAALRPLGIHHSWTESTSHRIESPSSPDEQEEVFAEERNSQEGALATSLDPVLFLCIHF